MGRLLFRTACRLAREITRAVRLTVWVSDFGRLKSMTWRVVDQIFTSWNQLTSWLGLVNRLAQTQVAVCADR